MHKFHSNNFLPEYYTHKYLFTHEIKLVINNSRHRHEHNTPRELTLSSIDIKMIICNVFPAVLLEIRSLK